MPFWPAVGLEPALDACAANFVTVGKKAFIT
jgi:hypothetical protein